MNTATQTTIKFAAAILVVSALAFAGMMLASQAGAQTLSGTVVNATSTNATSTDVTALQNRVAVLEGEVDSLRDELADLRADFVAHLAGHTGTTTPGGNNGGNATTSPGIMINPESSNARAGTSVDFNGRGYWANEQVTIMKDAQVIGVARADGGGNFSTGSLPVPRESGSYTYVLRGDWSGMTGTAVVHVTQ